MEVFPFDAPVIEEECLDTIAPAAAEGFTHSREPYRSLPRAGRHIELDSPIAVNFHCRTSIDCFTSHLMLVAPGDISNRAAVTESLPWCQPGFDRVPAPS